MISLEFSELARVLGADPEGLPQGSFCGVTIDSRQSCEQRLFVAIRGDQFDGHNFIDKARQSGAAVALVEERQSADIVQIVVQDCKQAMARLANFWRHQCAPCVIGLTGSNGKTTVKEMTYQILSRQFSTLATRGNFNNDIGVPLTLFELDPGHEFAIIEMGANHRGEIANLASIAEPDIVYVNNVAAAHLAGFGSLQGVVESKGELYVYCGQAQQALFNTDEVASRYWRQHCAAGTQMNCGLGEEADVHADWSGESGSLRITFHYENDSHHCQIPVAGEHNVRNAVAAVALALMAGCQFADAVANLAGFSGVKGRLQMLPGPQRSRVIDDSYNANPDSLEAGIRVLCALPGAAWLALGDMGELGSETQRFHREAAQTALQLGVERFYGIGEMSCIASEEFGEAGHCSSGIEEAAEIILSEIHGGVNLLVKGSRSAGMERLVARLTNPLKEDGINAV